MVLLVSEIFSWLNNHILVFLLELRLKKSYSGSLSGDKEEWGREGRRGRKREREREREAERLIDGLGKGHLQLVLGTTRGQPWVLQ